MSQAAQRRPESVLALVPEREGVCIITQNVGFGGMEVHTLGLMNALIARGHSIELVANHYAGYDALIKRPAWEGRVRLIHTDLGGILTGDRIDVAGWRRVLGDLRSKVLLFPKGNYCYGHVRFLRECRRAFQRMIFIEHLEATARPRGQTALWWHKRRFMSKLGSRYADTIVAVSEKVKDRLVSDIGYAASKVVVVRNGVPWQDFTYSAERGRTARVRYGIAPETFVFGMLTRLTPAKGIDTALRALRLLEDRRADHNFALVIAGDGYEAANLGTLAADLGIAHRVKFLGFVDRPDEILSAYDVILFSSRVEGLPLGLLEGMAAGCIPVVTRISGMPEVVSSPDLGWVVEPEDPLDLCRAMERVLTLDERRRAELAMNVRQHIRENFDSRESNRQMIESGLRSPFHHPCPGPGDPALTE